MQTSTEFVVDFIEFIDSNRIELNRSAAQRSTALPNRCLFLCFTVSLSPCFFSRINCFILVHSTKIAQLFGLIRLCSLISTRFNYELHLAFFCFFYIEKRGKSTPQKQRQLNKKMYAHIYRSIGARSFRE